MLNENLKKIVKDKSFENKRVLVNFSGGIDSTTLLFWLLNQGAKVEAISFYYGSKHNEQELTRAYHICNKYEIKQHEMFLEFIQNHFKSNLLLKQGDIPEGDYEEDNMKSTVVPFRNGIMLSIAAGLAESRELDYIALANHSGDHHIYPDCRPDFCKYISQAIEKGTSNEVKVLTPFCNLSKTDIIKIGNEIGVDYSLTYSCYKGGKIHCGKCATCIERKTAFEQAGIEDPTGYENFKKGEENV